MSFFKDVGKALDPKKNGVSKGFEKAFSQKTWKPVGKVGKSVGEGLGKGFQGIGKGVESVVSPLFEAYKSLLGAIPGLANLLPILLIGGSAIAVIILIIYIVKGVR